MQFLFALNDLNGIFTILESPLFRISVSDPFIDGKISSICFQWASLPEAIYW